MDPDPSHTMSRRALLTTALGAGVVIVTGQLPAQTTPATQPAMLTRPIPSTGQPLPVIGLGTWQTFDPSTVDDAGLAPLREVLAAFHAAGGRVVDSSPMYGKAEQVTGQLSNDLTLNADLFLATKVWTRGKDAGVRQMERSLQLMGRQGKPLDLIQVHNLLDWQTHLATLRQWKAAGRVKYVGVTHYVPSAFDQLERIVRDEQVDFVQLPYSVAVRDAERRLLPACKDRGVAVLVNRPFEEGALFDRVRGRPLPDFAKAFADTWAQAFLKFIVAHDAVTCVIPATSKVTHLRDNARAGSGRLPDADERRKLVDALA